MQKPVDGPLRGDRSDKDVHHLSLDRPLHAALARITGGVSVLLASDYGASTTGEIVHADAGFHVAGMVLH